VAIWIRDPDTDTDPYRNTGKTCLHVSRRQHEMYIGHACRTVSVYPWPHAPLLHVPGCNLGGMVGVPPSCALWTDLQSVHGFHCYDIIAYDNIARRRNVSECLYSLYPVYGYFLLFELFVVLNFTLCVSHLSSLFCSRLNLLVHFFIMACSGKCF